MATLALPMEKTITTIESYGNTAAASIPLTLQKAWETGRLRKGSRVMLAVSEACLGSRAVRMVTAARRGAGRVRC
jgi:3-oxoacyl-[acyl-carrier-protein] synthase III